MKITFLGAVQEVTGSKYLIEHEDTKILVDCGLFQGVKELRIRNWDEFPVDQSSIDAVFLTHSHIDHTGYIPLLVKNGFKGKIYCSYATFTLCSLLLVDSGMLQEEDAKHANKHGYSNHNPALPLYTKIDAVKSLKFFKVIDYNKVLDIGKYLKITFTRSGHILGSSSVTISDGKKTITFSGDLGRYNHPIIKPPTQIKKTDYLVMESTYGDSLHEKDDPIEIIGDLVNKTVKKGGVIIIPAFALGRTQTVLYYLYKLKQKKAIPNIPIFLDSPMAISITDVFCKFKDELKISPIMCKDICGVATYTSTVDQSKQIDRVKGSSIIIAGSGMVSGGRVLHHFRHGISDSKNTILFVGFQAEGTNGRALVEGAKELKIHGKMYPVHAEIKTMNVLSAHADYNEILEWLENHESSPKKIFITHGEITSALSLKNKIEERFGWSVVIPKYLDSFELD